MANITELAPEIFRISTFLPEANLQFNQFLIRDDEPLLYHTGMRQLFPDVREAVAQLMDPADLRWIGFSHFEPDECGSLNEWLRVSPQAQPLTSTIGAMVFIGDYADRAPHALASGESMVIGTHRVRLQHTPHLPHGWDASMLLEETSGVLFCSDLLHQLGDVPAMTESSVIERSRAALADYQRGPFANYMPYTRNTKRHLQELADLEPRVCATMHGSAFAGDGARALVELGDVMRDVLDG